MTYTTAENLQLEDVSPAYLIYGLMSAFALLFVPVLLALIINLSQGNRGKLLSNHIKWQRWSILLFLLATSVCWSVPQLWLASSIFALASLWFVSRIIRGWMRLTDGQMI